MIYNRTLFGGVRNLINYENIFEAVVDDECFGTGVPSGFLETDATFATARSQLRSVYESPPLPYAVLVVPPELLFPDRDALQAAYLELGGVPADAETLLEVDPTWVDVPEVEVSAENSEFALPLVRISGTDGVIAASNESMAEVIAFMESTGINLAQFGR